MNSENSYLFKFAWKSIRRNAGRSFFIAFSVSLAVFIAIWDMAFFHGMNYQIEKAVVNTNTGYFQLQDPLYAKSTDSSAPREWSPGLASSLSQNPIKAASPELVLDSNISTPEGAAGLLALGIDPELHQKFLPISKHTKEGKFLTEDDEGAVIIGRELARVFKFQVGDQIVLNYQDVAGELRSEILSIKGIFDYNSDAFEKRFIYLNQKTWQNLFLKGYSGKTLFNRVTLNVESLEEAAPIEKIAKDQGLTLKSWKDLNPEMAVVLEFHDGMVRFFFLIIGMTITMTIMTPIRMLWQERFKELKMMAILGASRSKFWKIGLFEVLQMILLSSLISVILIVTVIGFQSYSGVDFRWLGDGIPIERSGIRLPGIIYPRMHPDQVIITLLFVVLVLGFSYVWSIYRTLKKLEAEI